MKKIFFLLLAFYATTAIAQKAIPDYPHVKYDEGENNWLNIYQPERKQISPVLLWAHPNGKDPSADDFPDAVWQQLRKAGVILVSWESVPQILSANDIMVCENDFDKVLKWVKTNAAKYGIDTNQIFVGGQSRGSIVSFPGANKSAGIKGAYFVQALPNGGWKIKDFRNDVSAGSPNMVLAYAEPPETTNGHTPLNGFKIKEKYESLGIGNKIKVYDSLGKENIFKYLVDFIKYNTK